MSGYLILLILQGASMVERLCQVLCGLRPSHPEIAAPALGARGRRNVTQWSPPPPSKPSNHNRRDELRREFFEGVKGFPRSRLPGGSSVRDSLMGRFQGSRVPVYSPAERKPDPSL